LAPDDEKGRGDVLAAQDRRDPGCPPRVGTIVERKRNASPRRRLGGDETVSAGRQDRAAARERRGTAEWVVGLRAHADRVGRKALEEDQRHDDQQAETQQAPVRRRTPEARVFPARDEPEHQRVFAPARPRLGVVVVAVVVVAAVVVATVPASRRDLGATAL